MYKQVPKAEDRPFVGGTHMTNQYSPFPFLARLRSLRLELLLYGYACDAPPKLQYISCLTQLHSLSLLWFLSDRSWDCHWSPDECSWNVQQISQVSSLTRLHIHEPEEGLSSLVKVQHLSVDWMHPYASDMWPLPGNFSVLSCLTGLECGIGRHRDVSSLSVLPALQSLVLDLPREGVLWAFASLPKLSSLESLEVKGALLLDSDFEHLACLTKLTSLPFDGIRQACELTRASLNKLSTLTRLGNLRLEFGPRPLCYHQPLRGVDSQLKMMLRSSSMLQFQIKCLPPFSEEHSNDTRGLYDEEKPKPFVHINEDDNNLDGQIARPWMAEDSDWAFFSDLHSDDSQNYMYLA